VFYIMAGVNKVILIGNLGKDPELKYFEGNIAKLSFSLATSEIYKDKNGNRSEHTEWHHIVFWRNLAESAEKILKKGMMIYLEGKIQSRQWADKDGQKKNITEIVGESFLLLNNREKNNSNPNNFDNDSSKDNLGTGNLPY